MMKKRILCILLTLMVSINLTACGTKEAEEPEAEPVVMEETVSGTEKIEAEIEDAEIEMGITEADMDQLYELVYVLSNYTPPKEEAGKVPVEDWLDYLILSDSITDLDVDSNSYWTASHHDEAILRKMELEEIPPSISAYKAMWVLKNVLHIDFYTMADLNAINQKEEADTAIYYDGMIYKHWEKEREIKNPKDEGGITLLFQNENEVSLKIGSFYVTAHLETDDKLRYWSFDYWGSQEDAAIEGVETESAESTDQEWKEAYKTFLLDYEQYYYDESRPHHIHDNANFKFNLVYVDEDEIPELAIIDECAHPCGAEIYTYYEGEVIYIGGPYGQYGAFSYVTKGNLILANYDGGGYFHDFYYKIENGTEVLLVELDCYITWLSESSTEETIYTYYVDKEEVVKEEYDKQVDYYYHGNEFTTIDWDNGTYDINEENLQTILE